MHKFIYPVILFTLLGKLSLAQVSEIDLKTVPFSRMGSYMCFSLLQDKDDKQPLIYLRDVSGNLLWQWNGVFRLEVLEIERPVAYEAKASGTVLTLSTSNGKVEVIFQDTNTVRFRGSGVGLKLTRTLFDANSYLIPLPGLQWRIKMGSKAEYAFTRLKGEIVVSGPQWGVRSFEHRTEKPETIVINLYPGNENNFEGVLEQYTSGWKIRDYKNTTFEEELAKVNNELKNFYNTGAKTPQEYEETKKLAQYVNWSSIVAPRVNMTRHGMLMSKRNMRAVWSWDHCFNALASRSNPKIAWENYILPFDYQHEQGSLPDIMNDNNVTWGFLKPPIHGWTLKKLMEKPGIVDENKLKELYPKLAKWTEYWFKYMDDDKNGIPQYNHGNDSGWDNATVFDLGFSVESPDLCAFLILQMEVLSELAQKLGKKEDEKMWMDRSQALFEELIRHFWNGDKFVSRKTFSGQINKKSQSLISYIPLILGKRLPENYRSKMIKDLKTKGFLTANGLASESPQSPFYEADGYWRGPIWAPTTYIMVEALKECGETALAREIAVKYCNMCKKSGFGENFNALTGEQLQDSGYTWTSSVFLLLLEEYVSK